MAVTETTFDIKRYWEERLQEHPDITGVGYLGYSLQFVELYYRSRRHQVEYALRRCALIDLAGRCVLDVGSGTGIWLNFWHQRGVHHVTALDFAQPSVDMLKTRFPDDLIVQADVSVTPLPLPSTACFDIISAFEIFLHVLDRAALERAISNMAKHCKPGGWLIISDPIAQGSGYMPVRTRATYCTVRPLAEYQEVLATHGFSIEAVYPATSLLCMPLEAPNRLTFRMFSMTWRVIARMGRSSRLTSLLGPIVMRADSLACRLFTNHNAPGSKIILARKQS
ncbi:MAG: class I SAM-dependent methyltransferase [Ktedonobacteraceae bacterium]